MKPMLTVVSGALTILLAGISTAGFTAYTDLQLTKSKLALMEKTMEERETTTNRFTDMMHSLDKTVAVQAEAVHTLQEAVIRLEKFVLLAYDNEQKKKLKEMAE